MTLRRCLLAIAGLLALSLKPLPAQRADSVAVARRLMRVAASALRSGDTTVAVDSALQAIRAWPRQGARLVPVARLAVAAGMFTEALSLLETASEMGFGWNSAAPEWQPLIKTTGFGHIAERAIRNGQPLTRSSVLRTLPAGQLHPEGVAWDPGTGRVFVSSIRQRKVIVVEPDGRITDFVTEDSGALNAVFGMAVDTTRGLLWLASSPTPEQAGDPSGPAAVIAVELETGEVVRRWLAPDDGERLLGDVVLAPDGSVWSTDSKAAVVYRIDPDSSGSALTVAASSPDWGSLQGLTFSPDGGAVWLADWTSGIYRIDIPSGRVDPVASPPGGFDLGIDGLYLLDEGRLIAIQNGIFPARVVSLELDPSGLRIESLTVLDRHLPIAEEPTLGTLIPGGLLYVANSPWGYYGSNNEPDPNQPFPRPVLLRLPLDR